MGTREVSFPFGDSHTAPTAGRRGAQKEGGIQIGNPLRGDLPHLNRPGVDPGGGRPGATRAGRPFEVALSAVGLADKSEADTLKWAQVYADERKHRFPVPPKDKLN